MIMPAGIEIHKCSWKNRRFISLNGGFEISYACDVGGSFNRKPLSGCCRGCVDDVYCRVGIFCGHRYVNFSVCPVYVFADGADIFRHAVHEFKLF